MRDLPELKKEIKKLEKIEKIVVLFTAIIFTTFIFGFGYLSYLHNLQFK